MYDRNPRVHNRDVCSPNGLLPNSITSRNRDQCLYDIFLTVSAV